MTKKKPVVNGSKKKTSWTAEKDWLIIAQESVNDVLGGTSLVKRLLPFFHKYHADFDYTFCPDLASAHYSKATTDWMEKYVNYIPKNLNPPNVPQARPIENF